MKKYDRFALRHLSALTICAKNFMITGTTDRNNGNEFPEPIFPSEFIASWSNPSRDAQRGSVNTKAGQAWDGSGSGGGQGEVQHGEAFARRVRRARGAAPLSVEEKMAIQEGFR